MLLKPLRYLAATLRYPALKDYLDMGFGIEARFARCRRYWEPHLRLCKEFSRTAVSNPGGELCILGAGRLLDVDWEFARKSFSAVHLVDCDPSCRAAWRQFRAALHSTKVHEHCCDLTTVVQRWTGELQQFVARPLQPTMEGLCTFFKTLKVPECTLGDLGIPVATTVFSLNLLSQLPIYLRDRWIAVLADTVPWALRPDGQIVQDLEGPLHRALGALQAQHLRLLATSGARTVVLITDRSYLYYRKDMSAWQEEPALFVSQPLSISGYARTRSDCWFWHIAPQGLEQAEYGSIHDVVATQFDAVDSPASPFAS